MPAWLRRLSHKEQLCWRKCCIGLLLILGIVVVVIPLYENSEKKASPPLMKSDEGVRISGTYVFSFTLIPPRVKYFCTVLESLWKQTVSPQDVLVFHGPDVKDLPDCRGVSRRFTYTAYEVPDTGPAIRVRHLLKRPEGEPKIPSLDLPPERDVIVVDDDSILHNELAEVLLRGKRNYPGAVIVNDPESRYEYYRVNVWGARGYLLPGEVLRQVEWHENPKCTFDDDVWLGHIFNFYKVLTVGVPGVLADDIWWLQIEKWLYSSALSRSVNADGSNRSLCSRSLLTALPLEP